MALFVVTLVCRHGGKSGLEAEFCQPGRFKLSTESWDVRGLELLPKFQRCRIILFRRIDSRKLRGGRSCVRAVKFAVQPRNRPSAAPQRRRSGSSSSKASGAAAENASQFFVESRDCVS